MLFEFVLEGGFHSSFVEVYAGNRMRDLSRLFALGQKEYWVKNYTWLPEDEKWVIEAGVGVPLSGKPMEKVVVEYPASGMRRLLVCGPTALIVLALLPLLLYRGWARGG